MARKKDKKAQKEKRAQKEKKTQAQAVAANAGGQGTPPAPSQAPKA